MKPSINRKGALAVAALALLLSAGFGTHAPARAQAGSRYFPETGHTVKGRFLEYWETHGGLMQQGYPISDEMQDVSDTNGGTYAVQYFERAVFEYHPENPRPYDVLLSLLGVFEHGTRYGAGGDPNQQASTDNGITFAETGKSLAGPFRTYWETHGGLTQQGYPISNELQETSALNGKTYTVQYFQRAVFEYHPENAGTPFAVLLSQLGTLRYRAKYLPPPNPTPGPTGQNLYSLAMVSASEGWATGDNGTLVHYSGGQWQPLPSTLSRPLFGVDMLSASDGWAVGPYSILHFTGGQWQALPGAENYAALLYAVDMVSQDEGWAVGEGGPKSDQMLHYRAGAWKHDETTNIEAQGALGLSSISMVSATEGWAVGAGGTLHYTGGRWVQVPVPQGTAALSVSATAAGDAWAVGRGALLHYQGGAWTAIANPAGGTALGRVRMTSSTKGWAVGAGGVILHYTGGAWSRVSSPTSAGLSDVAFVSPTEGWAVGERGTIIRYLNGTWGVYR